jgi:23S rRNA G2069 N7-methylase RlmK/C1962 C5-methylase RlmI
MASKRVIKKQLNALIVDVIDECFSIQLYNEAKTEVTDKLIEEVLVFGDNTLSQIHQAKSKKDYPAIKASMEEKTDYFIGELNGLQ